MKKCFIVVRTIYCTHLQPQLPMRRCSSLFNLAKFCLAYFFNVWPLATLRSRFKFLPKTKLSLKNADESSFCQIWSLSNLVTCSNRLNHLSNHSFDNGLTNQKVKPFEHGHMFKSGHTVHFPYPQVATLHTLPTTMLSWNQQCMFGSQKLCTLKWLTSYFH